MSLRVYFFLLGVAVALAFGPARSTRAQLNSRIPVRGHVFESSGATPLVGVNVFLVGTTIGASTDRTGSFRFLVPADRLEYEITASMIGFEVKSVIRSSQSLKTAELTFRLEEKTYRLDEVTVSASNSEWLKILDRFKRAVFSTSEYAKQCIIVSPEHLSIEVDKVTGVLLATSNEPFVFRNRALGYTVSLHSPKISASSTRFRWEGSLQFQALTPETVSQHKQWDTNRARIYSGSIRHFLSAVAAGKTNELGFFIAATERPGFVIKHKVAPDPSELISVEIEDPTVPTWRLFFPQALAVAFQKEGESRAYRTYLDENGLRGRDEAEISSGRLHQRPTQNSWLRLTGAHVVIDQLGNEYGEFALERSGYWEWERMCDLLPSDYASGFFLE